MIGVQLSIEVHHSGSEDALSSAGPGDVGGRSDLICVPPLMIVEDSAAVHIGGRCALHDRPGRIHRAGAASGQALDAGRRSRLVISATG